MAAMKLVYGYRIKPARFEDWRALNREGDKIVQRLGGHNLRAMAPTAAGPESTVNYSTIDFVDGAHLGTFLDAAARDLETQTLLDRLSGHTDSPTEMLYSATITELPLDLPKGQGTVLDVWVTRVRPGRFDDAIALTVEGAPLSLDNGAIGVRLFTVDAAGSEVGRSVWIGEYESFEAYGRCLDAQAASTEARELMERLVSADSPVDVLQHTLLAEVPMH
jgi:hypothetical protein